MAERSHSRIFKPDLLDGQVCVVSGAGSGLGRETALELARLGAAVVGCGRREEPLAETAGLAADVAGSFAYEALDIRDEEAVDGFFEGVIERFGNHRFHRFIGNIHRTVNFHDFLPAGPGVAREHVQNSIRIERKLHAHPRHAFGGGLELKFELAERPIVPRHLSLPL